MSKLLRLILAIATIYLAVALFVVGSTYLPAIGLLTIFPRKGTLIVKLTDAPVELKHLNLTISSLSAVRVEYVFSSAGKETWDRYIVVENLTFVNRAGQVNVDILALRNVTQDLSITEIPPGNYTNLRMTITAAKATFIDGKTMDLIVPSGHINLIIDFEIETGKTTVLLIDIEADWVAISHSGRLRPVLKASVVPDQ